MSAQTVAAAFPPRALSAAVSLRVADYYTQGPRSFFRLHEKGGRYNVVPAHHTAQEYVDAYLEAARIGEDRRGPLFRSCGPGRRDALQQRGMSRVSALVAHEESGYEEWGASGSVRVNTSQSGKGLTFSLAPVWGAAGSASERLWSARNAGELGVEQEFEATTRLETEFGYGMSIPRTRGVGTPYTGLSLAQGTSRTVRAGARWQLAPGAVLGLEGSREGGVGGNAPTKSIMFRTELRW